MIFYIGAETTMLFGAGLTRGRINQGRTGIGAASTGAGWVLEPHRPASQLVHPKVKVDKIALK
jgi:hypothetical protein